MVVIFRAHEISCSARKLAETPTLKKKKKKKKGLDNKSFYMVIDDLLAQFWRSASSLVMKKNKISFLKHR
jgi:hypothetical protein